MKKIRINVIVLLVIIAMFSLLFIQLFQTAQLYDRKSAQFRARIQTLIETIAVHHEKADDIRKYLQVVNKDFSGQYKDILKKEFQSLLAADESISIKDTTILESGELKKFLIIKGKSFDSLSGLTAEHRVLARDVRQLRQLFNKDAGIIKTNDSSKVSIQLDQRVMQHIFKKAKFINEIMIEAFRDNVYDEPIKRINIEFLDSVISQEVRAHHLPAKYQFLVTDEFGNGIKFKFPSKKYNLRLDTNDVAQTILFPQNILDEKLKLFLKFDNESRFVFKEMGSMMIVNIGLMLLIVVAISFMFKTIITQKKLSEMKNDFISNMTHEFKTPISTISLACQALGDKDMVKSANEESASFVKMIKDENKRLEILVERILQSAVIDRGELKLKNEMINLSEILNDLCLNAQLKINSLNGSLITQISSEPIFIFADRFHTSNVFSNLIDNAIKYSKEKPVITISLKKRSTFCMFDC
jgi:two-component system, OmpR family, phosphate regulon sensor histidine kinase PhoR